MKLPLLFAVALLAVGARADEDFALNPAVKIRGVHITSWQAASPAWRKDFIQKMKAGNYNAIDLCIKENEGDVFVRGVALADQIGATRSETIKDMKVVVDDFKSSGFYTMARVILFKDKRLAEKLPDLAVHSKAGGIWHSNDGSGWINPYNEASWDYNLEIAQRAVDAGFDEIQFDYIRFPSDGPMDQIDFSYRVGDRTVPSPEEGKSPAEVKELREQTIARFLKRAHAELSPRGAKLSIDVFGLTASRNDMSIGQNLDILRDYVDYIYPMMYPSHYSAGNYDLPSPVHAPYAVIQRGMADFLKRLQAGQNDDQSAKAGVFIQDFDRNGVQYTEKETRAEVAAVQESDACRLHGACRILSWNKDNKYNPNTYKPGPMLSRSTGAPAPKKTPPPPPPVS